MITYYDIPHTYVHDDGSNYRSVTSVLGTLKPDKDWDEIKRKYAKKNKMTIEEVTAKWDHEKDISIVRGTNYHLQRELDYVEKLSAIREFGNSKVDLQIVPSVLDKNQQKSSLGSLNLKDGIYPELIVWLDSVKLAGQADRVEIYDNKINIIDYKTSKKIDTKPYVRWDGSFDTLKAPCNHLGECNANIYYLQLNAYAYMIKKHNPFLEIGDLIVEHILFDDDGNPTDKVDYHAPDMQKEVGRIMKMVKKGLL